MSSPRTLPPDRSHVGTELRNPKSTRLDALDTGSFIELMVDDQRKVGEAVAAASGSIAAFIEAVTAHMSRAGRLIYIGAGTSGRLGVLDASECPPTFQSDPSQVIGIIAGGDSALRRSSEGKEDELEGAREVLLSLRLSSQDTVLGIAAGGTTPYVLGALSIAKSQNATTGLLTCAPPRERPACCDHLIVIDTGPEVLTGSTRLKAGSATKLALNIISTGVFVRLGKVYGNLMVDLRATNAKLQDRAIRILRELVPGAGMDRNAANALLERAGGQLKVAIVMARLNIDRAQAEGLLTDARGSLRKALGE